MTENEIRTLIQSWENLALMVRYIADYPEYLDLIMSKALDDSQPENWRAMWMVDKIHEKHPELVIPYFPVMTDFLLRTQNNSKRRHLLKLISENDIPEETMAVLLNYCIPVFTNASLSVAVRVHAMQILFNIAQKEPDFSAELIELIEQEIEFHGSAGIASRGRKLIQKLKAHPLP
ncbi:MAG: hypothetical protein Q8S54_08825 [Bacteroidota bacterium]|nr:hypothetical protein [Odoribacter sp.]MDP3643275.1 hypothetical protein [Bacteroidota bacterium]